MKHLCILALALLTLIACHQDADSSSHTDIDSSIDNAMAKTVNGKTDIKTAEKNAIKVASSKPLVIVEDKFEVVKPQRECSKPVVIEFYAYHCPHCYSLQPTSIAWKEKNKHKVDFISVPTDLGAKQFGILILLHHAAKALGVEEKYKAAMFHRVNVEKKLFGSEQEAADFLITQGADKNKVKSAMNDTKALTVSIEHDWKLLKDYKVTSVPKVLVNHKYITDPKKAGGYDKIFSVVDELLKKEHNCK